MNAQDKEVLVQERGIANAFALRARENNKLRDSRLQQTSRLHYCRFLATRSFSSFREHYDFSPGAVTELQNLLDSQFDKIPYGWGVYQIDTGIARIIETFIKDRKIQRIGHNHISI